MELNDLRERTSGFFYEITPLPRLSIQDLDLAAFIFDDRVEVHAPGRPPNTVNEEAMRAGVHVVRNPRLYARLSDAGLVTRAGTGIRRIIRLVREATGQDILIAIREFETLLTIPRRRPTT